MIRILGKIKRVLLAALLTPLGLCLSAIIPKQRNLIVLEGTSRSRYHENARYLFEYLSKQFELDVYWITDDDEIKEHLKAKGLKCLRGTLEKFVKLLRAALVISTGSRYVDLYRAVGPKTIKYCLMHGIGPKATVYFGESAKRAVNEILQIDKCDFANFTSQYTANAVGRVAYKLPNSKIIVKGYPRNDHLLDKAATAISLEDKPWCRSIFKGASERVKVMLYTPTWRKRRIRQLPLFELSGFDLKDFGDYLKANDLYLIYTTHPHTKLDKHLQHQNIYYLDLGQHKMQDLNLVMPEIDLLLNDYSTTSTDFAILDRPQVFVMPDYDHFYQEDALLGDYRATLPGKEARNYSELKTTLLEQLSDVNSFHEARQRYLKKYYDLALANSCQLHYDFIKQQLKILGGG